MCSRTAGYTGVSEAFVDDDERYSFVFDGLSGELDHALAGPDLADNVTGCHDLAQQRRRAADPGLQHRVQPARPLPAGRLPGLGPRPAGHRPATHRAGDGSRSAQRVGRRRLGAATVDWEEPGDGGAPITGYEVRALESGAEVASVTVGPDARSHTFGQLTSGQPHTFEVVAVNAVGAGPAGSASATPFVPRHPLRLQAGVSCPAFTATNDNPYPVSVSWSIQHGARGDAVVPAGSTVTLDATAVPGGRTKLTLSADGRQQDQVTARC